MKAFAQQQKDGTSYYLIISLNLSIEVLFGPHCLTVTCTHHSMLPSLFFSALCNSHCVQFVICSSAMNYASLYCYLPDLHLLTSFLTLLPPSSVGRRRCDKIQFPTPLCDFGIVHRALLLFSLSSFLPQLSRVDIWWFLEWKQTGSGMVTVVKQKGVLMCFLLQAGEKPLFNQAWVLFFIPNQHVPSWCFRIRRSSFILEGFLFLVSRELLCWIHAFIWNGTAKIICSLEFLPCGSLSSWCFRPRWSPRRKYPCWIWMTVSLIPWLNGKIKSAFGCLCRISGWKSCSRQPLLLPQIHETSLKDSHK